MFAFIIQNSNHKMSFSVNSQQVNYLVACMSFILVVGNFVFMIFDLFEDKKNRVIQWKCKRVRYGYYLIVFYTAWIFLVGVLYDTTFGLYIMSAMAVLPIILTIYHYPYKN